MFKKLYEGFQKDARELQDIEDQVADESSVSLGGTFQSMQPKIQEAEDMDELKLAILWKLRSYEADRKTIRILRRRTIYLSVVLSVLAGGLGVMFALLPLVKWAYELSTK